MVNSIEQLKGEISASSGLALPNLYMVELPSIGSTSNRTLNVLCNSTQLPGRQILTHDRRISIKGEKLAYGYGVPSVTLSFKLLNDYAVKRYFDDWQNKMVDQENQQIRYANEYRASIKIWQLRKGQTWNVFNLGNVVDVNLVSDDEKIYGIELQKAFPTTITDIEFSDASNDQGIMMSAVFEYTNWLPINSVSGTTLAPKTSPRPAPRPTGRSPRPAPRPT